MRVNAQFLIHDNVADETVDVTPWFEQASAEDISKLYSSSSTAVLGNSGFGDEVAFWLAQNGDSRIGDLLEASRLLNKTFTLMVDEIEAEEWIKIHRPEMEPIPHPLPDTEE